MRIFFLLIYPFSKSCLDSMSKLNFKNTNITLKEESLHTLRCQSFTVRITIRIIIWKAHYTAHYLLMSKCSVHFPCEFFLNLTLILTRESTSSFLCWLRKVGYVTLVYHAPCYVSTGWRKNILDEKLYETYIFCILF